MLFLSNFFSFGSQSIQKLERQASDVLDLTSDLKAFRVNKEIIIVDSKKSKIIQRTKDTLPSNPVRATLELIKQLKLSTQQQTNKKADVWTCGFRENEARWVWYRNSEPVITASYEEVFKNGSLEDKIYFFSARYGTTVISQIKEQGIEKIAKQLNALVLENSFVKVKCAHCQNEEHYTIDDIVDENKNPKYDSEFIVCQNCNNIVKLM